MSWAANRISFYILGFVILLQAGMLLYDFNHPDVFLHADRSADRMQAIQDLLSFLQNGTSLSEFLGHQGTLQGVPGDYLIQGLVFYLGGQYAVIIFQILLFIASIVALYELALLVIHSPGLSAATILTYSLLPYGVVFPHMLWSESLFDPFALISFYFVARCVLREPSWTNISCAALFLALATLVRPTVLLWPIVVIATMWLCNLATGNIIRYAVLFLVIIFAWPSFIWLETGNFKMTAKVGGGVSHSANDLALRMKYMIDTLPIEERQIAEQRFLIAQESDRTLPVVISRYVMFGLTHPLPFTKELAHDVLIFVLQSGIERFTIDYLDLAGKQREALQIQQTGWRKILTDQGIKNTALIFLRDHGTIFISSAIGALAMLLLWGLAGLGSLWIFNGKAFFGWKERIMLLSMVLFPVYVFLPGQLFNYPQARYRAPAEFCLCILAVIGAWTILTIRNRARRAIPA